MSSFRPIFAALALVFVLRPGPAVAVQKLTLGSTTAPQEQSVAIPLGYVGDGSVVGLQLDITFDPAVLGVPSVSAGTGIGGQVLRSAVVASGRLRVAIYSPLNAAIGNGELARLSFRVKGMAPLGQSSLGLAGVVLGDANANAVVPTELVGGAITVVAGPGSFYTVAPCRLIDTRNPSGVPWDPGLALSFGDARVSYGGPVLNSGVPRLFAVTGNCGVPPTAKAISVNVTAIGATGLGNLRFFPGDQVPGTTSTINFQTGLVRANNAILPLSEDGVLGVQAFVAGAGQVHLVLDIGGYFN